MRAYSMTVALLAAFALAGCSEGSRKSKEKRATPARKASPERRARPARRAAKVTRAIRAVRGLPARRSGSLLRNHRPLAAKPTKS